MSRILKKPGSGSIFAGLTALCTMAYFVSYLTRINLGAVMVAVVESGFAPEATVALALSACSVTYGAGQIINGYISDRTKPQHVMLFGFLLTMAMNLGVCFLRDSRYLVAMWAVNGFAQSCMWPPLVAIMASHFNMEDYDRANVWVCWGSALGTIVVYMLSPVVIELWGYRWVFLISGCMALVMALIWLFVYNRKYAECGQTASVEKERTSTAADAPHEKLTGGVLVAMGIVMLAIVMQGALRDGITNWTPTLISQTLPVDTSAAIFSGVLLPVFHMICTKVISTIHRRWIPNELVCAAVVFTVGAAAALLLALTVGSGVISSVVLLALLVGCMHGVNYLLICLTPVRFFKYGKVGLISGVLNSSTYIGSAISTYGIAFFAAAFGWKSTVLLWAVIALAGALLCGLVARNKQLEK